MKKNFNKTTLLILSFAFLLVSNCKIAEKKAEIPDFPVLQGMGKPGQTNYYVCKEKKNGAILYHSSWCGDDSCWSNFYDKDGKLVEDTPEYGAGTENGYKVKSKVAGCLRTSKEYFATKASAANPR